MPNIAFKTLYQCLATIIGSDGKIDETAVIAYLNSGSLFGLTYIGRVFEVE